MSVPATFRLAPAKVRGSGYHLTNGWLQVDPTFASLKGYAKFEQMLKGN